VSEDTKQRTAQSVRDRLLALTRKRGEAYDLILTRYALERFLFRLSKSVHRNELILKGAMLFQVWSAAPHRATRDLDFLARGEVSPAWIEERVRAICAVKVEEDGLLFDLTDLAVREIREESRYGGVRARFIARLGAARIAVQIDFGVGDAVTPDPVEAEYPTLLDMEAPIVFAYPRETVIAEKLEAIVDLGMDNSRMKDYFDLWFMATTYCHDDKAVIKEAIRRTFERRRQVLPAELPVGLSDEFAENPSKQAQWKAFQGRATGEGLSLQEVMTAIRDFAWPIFFED
jgi:predicted nucleotidyltransferase component of viral defense system